MKVHLVRRKGKHGTTLLLKWWNPDAEYEAKRGKRAGETVKGAWEYEPLRLRLTGDKQKDKVTERLAEQKRLNREEELEAEAWGTVPTHKRKTPFVDYVEAQIDEVQESGKKVYQTFLHHLKEFPAGRVPVGSISVTWVDNFRKHLLARLEPSSAATNIRILKAILKKAVRAGIIQRSPADGVKSIKFVGKPRVFLTAEEVRALAATPCKHPELRRAFLFCCYAGLRFSDAKALKWSDYSDGVLRFRQKKTGDHESLILPKHGPAERLLLENMSFMPNIFSLPNNDRANIWLREWAAAAGIKKHLTYHVSRHTNATNLLLAGVDIYTVSKILGHKSIKVTEIYAHQIDKTKQAALAKLPDIDITLDKPAANEPKVVTMGKGNE